MSPMTLAPWRRSTLPAYDTSFLSLQQTMNDLFQDFAKSFDALPFENAPTPSTPMRANFIPRLDMYELENEIRISVELPGMKEKDIDVQLSDNTLIIKGEKQLLKEEHEGNYFRSERTYGSFQRLVPLPCEVNPDKVEAHYKEGVLILKLYKTEAGRRNLRKIKVKTD
ncbi:MAG: Hsp20/alpha crystallin family protein [Planctomycetota bacterium]